MANFSYAPTWTSGHGFAIGTEVNFGANVESADSLTDIPFPIGGLWVFGGSINYNVNNDGSAETTMLLRISIIGDPANGDSGGGPGSLLIVNFPLYVRASENARQSIFPFAFGLDNGFFNPIPGGNPSYKMHMKADIAGNQGNTHLEVAMCGMWR